MDPDSLFSLLMIILMIGLGTFFSAAETAFSALNIIRIKSIAEEGSAKSKRAALVLRMHEKFDKVLSTLLILNNVVTLVAAAITTLLAVRYWGELGATFATALLTVVVVFFGDITPKSLAKESPEKIAMACAPLLNICIWTLTPINFFFAEWKSLLGKISNTKEDDGMTEEELYSYVEVAHNDGVIDKEGKELLDSAIEFNELKAIDILTPRTSISGISIDASEQEIADMFLESEYSRLPVFEGSMDEIVGVVHMRDFFKYTATKPEVELKSIFTKPVYVAPSIKISDLFKELQKQKCCFAIVTDEYGGTAGIVTIEDILEELVGDIWDESDEVIVEFEPLGNNEHKIICSAYVKDMFAYFDLDDTEAESTTVSGWIMDKLEKLPDEGDSFTFENLTVSVSKTENRRVLECIITAHERQIEEQ